MAIVKAAPEKLAHVKTEFDRMFDRFFREPFFGMERFAPVMETAWAPPLDFAETEKEYLIRLEVPGIPKENLDVGLENNILTLSGRREFHKEEKAEQYIWQEREEGRFVRSLRLPTPVLEDKIEAMVEDGVLLVHLPKVESAKKSKILVK
jgi:HSP20 family protein